MKSTTTVFVQASTTSYYQPCVAIKKGRYGIYAVLNNINRSEKFMLENGFEIKTISKDEATKLMNAWNNYNSENVRQAKEQEMNDRAATFALCLECTPVEIRHNAGELCLTATLGDTNMINAYRGCGKGTAYVSDNKVVAFHYGHQQPLNIELYASQHNLNAVRVELSATQICFF